MNDKVEDDTNNRGVSTSTNNQDVTGFIRRVQDDPWIAVRLLLACQLALPILREAVCANLTGDDPSDRLAHDAVESALRAAEAESPDVGHLRGAWLIVAERLRQIKEEGWTLEHDDELTTGELAIAAACYALAEDARARDDSPARLIRWPWAPEWWQPAPDDRVRELEKAGALIAAEIDRLLRAKAKARKSAMTDENRTDLPVGAMTDTPITNQLRK